MSLRKSLIPMVHVDPVNWRGLPRSIVSDFESIFGPPEESLGTVLGYYPVTRYLYRSVEDHQGLVLWARTGEAVMVATLTQPPVSVLEELPDPCAVLAHEILVPGAYAHEFLYCQVGLVLTVAQPLSGDGPNQIVRCRGINPLTSPAEFGPAYYCSFEDKVLWDQNKCP